MRLIKLHIGLFRYIKIELKKKRTLKQFVKFVKELIVAYIKELIKLYKDLFLIFDCFIFSSTYWSIFKHLCKSTLICCDFLYA